MNKRTLKTLKLYMRVSFNPILTIFSIIVMVGLLIALITAPSPVGDKEYMSMICVVGTNGQIGILMMQLYSCLTNTACKFLISAADGKRLLIAFPVAVSLAMSLAWDVIVSVITAVNNPQALPDLLLVCSVGTVSVTAAVACFNKSGLNFIYLLGVFVCFIAGVFIGGADKLNNGFGFSLGAAAGMSAAIVVIGIGALVLVLSAWWKKSRRLTLKGFSAAFMLTGETQK